MRAFDFAIFRRILIVINTFIFASDNDWYLQAILRKT